MNENDAIVEEVLKMNKKKIKNTKKSNGFIKIILICVLLLVIGTLIFKFMLD